MTPPRRCTGDEFDWPSRSIQKEPKPRLAIYPMRLPEQTRQPIRRSRSCTSKVITRPRFSVSLGQSEPGIGRMKSESALVERRNNCEHRRVGAGHIRTRFNATHLSTPTENHVLHRCRRPHPPPRRPRAPRRLREVLQGALPRALLKSRGAIRAVFLGSSPRERRGKAGREGPERRRGAATSVDSRRETPRTAASRVEPRVARCGADDSTSRSPRGARPRRSDSAPNLRLGSPRVEPIGDGPQPRSARAGDRAHHRARVTRHAPPVAFARSEPALRRTRDFAAPRESSPDRPPTGR